MEKRDYNGRRRRTTRINTPAGCQARWCGSHDTVRSMDGSVRPIMFPANFRWNRRTRSGGAFGLNA